MLPSVCRWSVARRGLQVHSMDRGTRFQPVQGENSLSWGPVHFEHAIERMRIELRFSEPLTRKLVHQLGLRFDERRVETRFEPRAEQKVFKVSQGPLGPVLETGTDTNEVGWIARRSATKDNVPLEAVSLENSELAYESTDYKSWSKALARYQSVCGPLAEVAGALVNASAMVLEYTDRFVFDGAADTAEPAGILSSGLVEVLSESAKSGRELWHVHRGWFEDLGSFKCLINQNCDAQEGTTQQGRKARSVQIITKCELRATKLGIEITDAFAQLPSLHSRSKQVLASGITEGLARQIGLKEEA